MVLAPEHPLVDALTAGRLARRAPTDAGPAAHADPGRGGRRVPQRGRRQVRPGAPGRGQGEDRRLHRRATRSTRSTASTIPVFIADYVLMGYGTGAIMAVPGQDERDWEFAEALRAADRPHRRSRPTASRARRTSATARRSTPPTTRSRLDGLGVAEAKARDHRVAGGAGRRRAGTVTYKLRDWLFSRQRYWGEPFPIVYDDDRPADRAARVDAAGRAARDRRLLAAARSTRDDADSEPEPPLAAADRLGRRSSWTSATARSTYRRETNTMPQWAGSCWYELRYLDPTNAERVRRPGDRARTGWARAAPATRAASTCTSAASSTRCCTCCTRGSGTRCCTTWATCRSSEPFHRLFNQGYIQAYAYTDERGIYVAGRRGRRARRRRYVFDGRAGHPRVREDGQEPEERRSRPTRCATSTAPTRCGCTRCRWARWTRRGRGTTTRRRRRRTGSCSGCGATWSTRTTGELRVADDEPDDDDAARCCTARSPGCATTIDGAALQHRRSPS